ncbi:MAG TPA: DUF6134 family protein [Rudaea sp.]|nr:DUF6134 family protein [Rudaea sp.]
MKWILATSLSAIVATAFAATAPAPLAGFKANYEVLRNGKPLGKATLDLHNAGNDWEFVSDTQGTSGMAAMVGAEVHEKSTFTWNANKPQCLTYAFSQKALKSKTTSITCDWNAKSASVDDNGKPANVSLNSAAMDRHLVPLALMVDLKAGAQTLSYPVIDRAQVSDQQYVQSGHEILNLASGNVDTVKVTRDRGADAKRSTTYWFAPQKNWMPVQIEQVEKNGETITMRLASAK